MALSALARSGIDGDLLKISLARSYRRSSELLSARGSTHPPRGAGVFVVEDRLDHEEADGRQLPLRPPRVLEEVEADDVPPLGRPHQPLQLPPPLLARLPGAGTPRSRVR